MAPRRPATAASIPRTVLVPAVPDRHASRGPAGCLAHQAPIGRECVAASSTRVRVPLRLRRSESPWSGGVWGSGVAPVLRHHHHRLPCRPRLDSPTAFVPGRQPSELPEPGGWPPRPTVATPGSHPRARNARRPHGITEPRGQKIDRSRISIIGVAGFHAACCPGNDASAGARAGGRQQVRGSRRVNSPGPSARRRTPLARWH